jgi:hypothetical protein
MTVTAPELSAADLGRRLSQADPAALLVPPRILRRVIKHDRGLTGLGLQVPHRKSYVIAREALLAIADRHELGLPPDLSLPPVLLLFPTPEPQKLARRSADETLLRYWRLLFHARIHVALNQRVADGKLTTSEVRARVEQLGQVEFAEAAAVLRQEHFLLPPGDEGAVYEEFAALYLELRYFAPQQLPAYFPAVSSFHRVDQVLAQDVDADALLAATRLEGAPDPAPPSPPTETLPPEEEEERPTAPASAIGPPPPEPRYRHPRLMGRAERASACGNAVRSAILRVRAGDNGGARRQIGHLADRLRKALGLPANEMADWRAGLLALLGPAARGLWTAEGRLLYDLQKVCLDQERDIYAVDLVEWIVSWGRKPIKRHLPHHRAVLLVKHLRNALHRLTAVRIPEEVRRRLVRLLLDAVHHAEEHLRDRLRPVMRQALDGVGLVPGNVAEQVARDKLIEELIDRVIDRNFLTLGDLRDALARNRLKLPDLGRFREAVASDPPPAGSGWLCTFARRCWQWCRAVPTAVREFFLGDHLIRVNRQLASDLDGVYRRGEVYLRWLQRLSSLAFGTSLGRLLTLYVLLPFGCSLALLMVWQEVLELLHLAPPPPEGHKHSLHLNPVAFALLGLFFLALFHSPRFRGLLWNGLVRLWTGLRAVLHDWPAALLDLPWVRRVLGSKPYLLLYQFALAPLAWAALATLVPWLAGAGSTACLATAGAVFVTASLLLNSRLGMHVEEAATDHLVRTWQLIHSDLLPGLVRWVLYVFKRLTEGIEQVIYTVDEWLRFRQGEGRLSLVLKPVLGLIWFAATYLVRFVINLFVEPTFNPIKHFPTVTVAAKLLAPVYPVLLGLVATPLEPIVGKAVAYTAGVTTLFLLPGLAGFLVWELKENWKLYRANQSPVLKPEVVGSHGETVLRLMRPGLHSGTLPKVYARLRRGKKRSARRQYEALHHIREALEHFVQRNLLAVLTHSKTWGMAPPPLADVKLASNRLRLELRSPTGSGASIEIHFEERAGWLIASIAHPPASDEDTRDMKGTWLDELRPEQRLALRDALAGFCKQAGAGLVREQVAAALPEGASWTVSDEGLIVWPGPGLSAEAIYPLDGDTDFSPQWRAGLPTDSLRRLSREQLLFAVVPVYWSAWVHTWEEDHAGRGHPPLLPPAVKLLPG